MDFGGAVVWFCSNESIFPVFVAIASCLTPEYDRNFVFSNNWENKLLYLAFSFSMDIYLVWLSPWLYSSIPKPTQLVNTGHLRTYTYAHVRPCLVAQLSLTKRLYRRFHCSGLMVKLQEFSCSQVWFWLVSGCQYRSKRS